MRLARLLRALSEPILIEEGSPLLPTGCVGGVVAMITQGEVYFAGDRYKAARDDGMWRGSAFGEGCASATLGPGDAMAIGRPGEQVG